MITHQQIDRRIFGMVEMCVAKIDDNADLLNVVRENVQRIADPRINTQWQNLLDRPWPELKTKLLAQDDAGAQLRQNAPFGGLLTNAEMRSSPKHWYDISSGQNRKLGFKSASQPLE